MRFEVRGVRMGVVETLQVEAPTADEARRMAAQQSQLQVLSVQQVRALLPSRVKFDLTLFSQELSELLDAGLSVVEAVEALAAREQDALMNQVHKTLLDMLRRGLPLSTALESMPHCFPPLFVGLVRAAERTSDLHGALQRYLEYSGRLDALRNKITSALIYPSILFFVGGGVVMFLLGFVVPRFSTVYRGAGRELPALSALLLEWGAFAHAHAYGLLATLAVLVVGGGIVTVHAHRTGRLERALNLLPAVKHRVDLFRLARLYLTVGTLLNGGMPIVQALQLARDVISGRQRAALDDTVAALKRGEAVTDALARHELTTPVSLRLLRAGEGTGRMGDLFIRAGRYHDNELGRWVERFSKAFEPMLMAGIGILIGGIVILLYMPIFDLAGSFR